MHKQEFENIIIDNFNEIQRNFKSGLTNKGYKYDEDLINDTFISCRNSLVGKKFTKKEAIKYFWTAYINKYKTKMTKKSLSVEYLSDLTDIEEFDSNYDNTIDEIYDIIIQGIRDKFGLKYAYIWELYICYGKSSKEIRNMGFDVDNFVYLTRKIKRYIINHLIPSSTRLQELIQTRKEA